MTNADFIIDAALLSGNKEAELLHKAVGLAKEALCRHILDACDPDSAMDPHTLQEAAWAEMCVWFDIINRLSVAK